MRGDPAISSIWRWTQPSGGRDPEQTHARIWAWCRDLWIRHGTIAVKPSELPDGLRLAMIAWADETYGRRQ